MAILVVYLCNMKIKYIFSVTNCFVNHSVPIIRTLYIFRRRVRILSFVFEMNALRLLCSSGIYLYYDVIIVGILWDADLFLKFCLLCEVFKTNVNAGERGMNLFLRVINENPWCSFVRKRNNIARMELLNLRLPTNEEGVLPARLKYRTNRDQT